MAKFTFPQDFLWGTATAGHQIEGNNKNSDWWHWENRDRSKDRKDLIKSGRTKWPYEPSLKACDSYNRYEEDFDLAIQLNNNSIRIGVEWARLEPTKGKFNQKEFNHYIDVLEAAKERGLKTFVTLHHFTSPKWLADMGGWTNSRTPNLFARYAKKCAEQFGSLVDVYLTINEPQVYSVVSYLDGRWPPQKRSPLSVLACQQYMKEAHNKAYEEIKKVGDYKVGIVKNMMNNEVSPKSKNPLDFFAAKLLNYLSSDFFLKPLRKHMDIIGINFYFTNHIKNMRPRNPNDKTSDLGWWLEPKGIAKVLARLKKYNLPIYITENGLADSEDKYRTWYLKEVLKSCANALDEGVQLRGYFHWSLLDNYEWAEGYTPRFGLVEIDHKNGLKRIPRKSFTEYSKICKSGTIER